MDDLLLIYNRLITSHSAYNLILLAAIAILFFIQSYYYLYVYARIPRFKNRKKSVETDEDVAVSVVVVVNEDFYFINEVLPKLLGQSHDHFEIVVVDLSSNEEFSQSLTQIADASNILHVTKVRQQTRRFVISNKMALNIGIKAAAYQNIVITTVDCCPDSDRWLSFMAKGFTKGDVVIGYCGIERKKGLTNKLIRCSRLMSGVRYLSSAMRQVPYRGMIQNLGMTKKAYFDANGFNFLNLNIGEDDLFIQKIATPQNTSIVINPHATMRQQQWGGLVWWWNVRKFNGFAYRYYPLAVKNFIEWELGSRLLFLLSSITALIFLPPHIKIAVASLMVVRWLIISWKMWRIRKRLKEGGLGWALLLYDIVAPFDEIRLTLTRRINPCAGVWR